MKAGGKGVQGGGKGRSPTKALISKWNKPEELFWAGGRGERQGVQGGFQGVQPLSTAPPARVQGGSRSQFVPALTDSGDLLKEPIAAPR